MPMPSWCRSGLRTPSAATAYAGAHGPLVAGGAVAHQRGHPVARRPSARRPPSSTATWPPDRRGALAQHGFQPDLGHEDARRRAEMLHAIVDVAEEPLQLAATERLAAMMAPFWTNSRSAAATTSLSTPDQRNSSTVRCIRNAARDGSRYRDGARRPDGPRRARQEQRRRQAHQAAADDQDRNLNIPHIPRTYSAGPATAMLCRGPAVPRSCRDVLLPRWSGSSVVAVAFGFLFRVDVLGWDERREAVGVDVHRPAVRLMDLGCGGTRTTGPCSSGRLGRPRTNGSRDDRRTSGRHGRIPGRHTPGPGCECLASVPETRRRLRPTSRGWLIPSNTTGSTQASQPIRRAVSGVTWSPLSKFRHRSPLQQVEVDAEDDLGPVAAVLGQIPGLQGQLAHLDQGIGPPLPGRPVVAGAGPDSGPIAARTAAAPSAVSSPASRTPIPSGPGRG